MKKLLQKYEIPLQRKIKIILLITFLFFLCIAIFSIKLDWLGGKIIAGSILCILIYWFILHLWSDRKFKYALIIPTTTILALITVVPFIYLIYLSVHDVTITNFRKEWNFIGFQNYWYLINGNEEVTASFLRTIEFVAYSVTIETIIAMGLALLLNREFRGKGILFTLLLIPMMSTPIVVGMIWKYMLTLNNGLINQILEIIGLPTPPWLTNTPLPFVKNIPYIGNWLVKYFNLNYGFLSIVLTDVWQWTPFMFLIFTAGLHSLPVEPYEAAVVDGAKPWQVFIYITLPQLKNVILIAVLLRIMDALKVFDTIWALFGNSNLVRTLNITLYTIGLNLRHYSEGAALSILVLIFISLISMFFVKFIYSEMKKT